MMQSPLLHLSASVLMFVLQRVLMCGCQIKHQERVKVHVAPWINNHVYNAFGCF